MRDVYWHLPGFCSNFYINQIIINLLKEYPDKFNDGYKVGSVYGTFPGAIWNGGRAVLGNISEGNIKAILQTYERFDAPVRFTWTNSLITEEHLDDEFCNHLMDLADNGKNQVLCNSEILEEYLRDKYPDFKYISSTTKRLKGLDDIKAELSKDYFMTVLDYDLNHDEDTLNALSKDEGRVEILVDEICFPNCPKRLAHYKSESDYQLKGVSGKPFDCPNVKVKPSFKECMKRPAFISTEEIGSYIDKGFVNFKLIGRGLPKDLLLDSYMYYLVKPDERDFIRKKLTGILDKLCK